MQSFHKSARRISTMAWGTPAISTLFAVAVLAPLVFQPPVGGQIVQPPQILGNRARTPETADQEVISGVYLPTDRALSRALSRARERLGDREFHEALTFLQDLLARGEDSFLEQTGDDQSQHGLKATARQLIGDLPPDGQEAYERLYGPTARRQLEAALKSGGREGIAAVVRQYFHTSAGYEATYLLAQMEADQGHDLAATQLFRDLIDTPRAAARFEPQLSVAAAISSLAAGQRDSAAELIRNLVDQNPSGQVTLRGKVVALPARGGDALGWLTAQVGEVRAAAASGGDWLTLRGSSTRNVESAGGNPLLRARWEARVVNEPAIESYLNRRGTDFIQRGIVALPAAKPIAVQDVIIARTPDNVIAVDWRTGKRIWETRDEQELETSEIPADLTANSDQDLLTAQGRQLEERTWDDALAASLSSDGERVFVVRGMQSSRDDFASRFQMNPIFGRMGGMENVSISNRLSAYDLATQGKLVWELDGGRPVGPLAGAFFLGPPLAIDHTLFTMAEIRGALYLLAIDPATGHLEWQQQLIGLEQGIALDPVRRRVGVTPSYSSGILICPTAASTVVGVDVVRHELAWVYRYPREAPTPAEGRNFWQQQQIQNQLLRPNDQWLDSSAVIVDDRVLLTPPESSELHCVDLHTGKLLWKRQQGESLYIGGVDDGVVLLVGPRSIQGVRLADRSAAWKQESAALPNGVFPAGQGYLSQGHYFLPLTSGQIADVEMATGVITVAGSSAPDVSLGNLICYHGSVISQSPLLLDKFEQLEVMQKRTDANLARNPNDANALRELAEIKSAADDKQEAIRLLKRAFELAPDDPGTQQMLADTLLAALATDYVAYRSDVPLMSRLVHTREQQIDLLRIDAAGQDTPSTRLAAWDAYLRLADFTADEPAYLRMGDGYTVRSDRWIASRLGAIWSAARPEERRELSARITSLLPNLDKQHTSAEMRHFLMHLGEVPEAGQVRLALARFLVAQDRPQEAEIELLQLIDATDQSVQSAATEMLAKLANKADHPMSTMGAGWPRGQVKDELISNKGNVPPRDRTRATHPMLERQNGYRQLRVEQDFLPSFSSIQWFVALDAPEIVARDGFGNDVARWTLDQNRSNGQRDSNIAHGAQLGHMLFFTLGNEVMALDSRQDGVKAESEVLWPTRSSEDSAGSSMRLRRALAGTRSSRSVVYHAYSNRKRITGATANMGGALGPATPIGVIVQDDDELKCVDPLTGTTLWARSDVPAGCELFGDRELVFAADVGNHVAYVLRLSDGELLGKRDVPIAEWLTTSGRRIAQISFISGRKSAIVTITDIWSQKTVFQAEYSATARFSVVEPDLVAVVEPSGGFHLVDVDEGREAFADKDKVDAGADLLSIQTMRFGDELYLFCSGPTQTKSIGPPADYPIINGSVYAFDLKTGKQIWTGPAVVRNRGAILQQPSDLPLLVFADRQLIRDSATGGGSQLRVLCLDRRTGETVYRNDALPDTSANRFRIRGKTEPTPAVVLEMSAGKIVLTMTDDPRAPDSPANDDLETPKDTAEHGLRAVGQRLGDAMRGAFDSSAPNTEQQTPIQPKLPKKAPAGTKPKTPPDFDDD